MLQLQNLVVQVGQCRLGPIDIEVPTGGHLVLLGRSGVGKTVLLETIAGRHQPSRGSIVLNGTNVVELPPEQRKIGFVYQDFSLFPHLSVADNISFGLRRQGVAARRCAAATGELAERLGITALLARKPRDLSGGEKQRVALARALATRPALLLLDEPMSALDYSTKQDTRALIAAIHDELAPLVLHVTHDLEEAIRMGSHIAVLRAGLIAHCAPVAEVAAIPVTEFLERYG